MKGVTQQILDINEIYGASENSAPYQVASSRSLNYVNGASIQNPEEVRLTKIPFSFNFKDAVGLFGVENYFVRVNMNVIDTGSRDELLVNSYEAAKITTEPDADVNTYEIAVIDSARDLETVNTYEPARITASELPAYLFPAVSVELINNKTGNQYIDRDLDVRLYTKDRQEWDFNKMYLKEQDYFYIGFHARNTRRLPYNVTCIVGEEYLNALTLTPEEQRLKPNL